MSTRISRRRLLKGAGGLALAAATGPLLAACSNDEEQSKASQAAASSGAAGSPAVLRGTELKILQWSHFVPKHDQWFDPFSKKWGEDNGVSVSVDHIDLAQLRTRAAAEFSAGQGHDLIELLDPPSDFEPSVFDLRDLNEQAQKDFGKQLDVARNSSFNPTTGVWYGFCHGWVPDPGDYRKSLWEKVGFPNGPATWDDLLNGGKRIKNEQEVQMGIGMSNEIDSNMAGRALLWSFGASIQDKDENVVINSDMTVSAVQYMKQLYNDAMTDEIFSWNAASNNQALIAGRASYILNSISAYRTAQGAQPDVADDVFFTPALKGPDGTAFASEHVIPIYIIPKFAKNAAAAKEFILNLLRNYKDATGNSELYTFPSFADTVPDLNSSLDSDPYGSNPPDKLKVLKTATDWTTNVGHPGPANAAIGEVFATFVIPNMFAKAARGDMSPQAAVADAEAKIKEIFQKWRGQGLVGGSA